MWPRTHEEHSGCGFDDQRPHCGPEQRAPTPQPTVQPTVSHQWSADTPQTDKLHKDRTRVSRVVSELLSVSQSSTQHYTKRAEKNISFESPDLLRATTTRAALRHNGEILRQQPCTAELYNLSSVADHLDTFVSHNWSTSRWNKFLVLVVHFNAKPAFLCWLMTVVTMFIVQALGYAPLLSVQTFGQMQHVGLGCTVCGAIVWFMTIFRWHDATRWLGFKGPSLFLDKACVHQTDEALKRRGIEHIAAFLYFSWSMLICYSELYLHKLWTVYEVSSFMLLHPGGKVDVRPEFFPVIILSGFGLRVFHMVVWVALHSSQAKKLPAQTIHWATCLVDMATLYPAALCFALFLRRWIEEQIKIYDHIREFRIADAQCFDERDRAVVQTNIEAFMKHYKHAPASATKAETLEAFEALVHEELPRLFAACLGRTGIPYRALATISLPQLAFALDYLSGQIGANRIVMRDALCNMVLSVTMSLALIPLATYIVCAFARRTLHWKGRRWCGIVAFTTFLSLLSVWIYLVFVAVTHLSYFVAGSDMGWPLIVMLVFVALLFILTYLAFRPPPHTTYRRRLNRPAVCDAPWEELSSSTSSGSSSRTESSTETDLEAAPMST